MGANASIGDCLPVGIWLPPDALWRCNRKNVFHFGDMALIRSFRLPFAAKNAEVYRVVVLALLYAQYGSSLCYCRRQGIVGPF